MATAEPYTCGGCCTRITNLSVSIGPTPIIENVNLHLHCGELTVITGPNGAGKSTLLKAVAGELPFTGEILFHRFGGSAPEDSSGRLPPRLSNPPPPKEATPRIGYVPQKLAFDPAVPMTVEDLFAICISKRPRWLFRTRAVRDAAAESLSAVDAAHLISRRLGCLSGGELQRVILSLALTPLPDILLLDEPLNGVDAAGLNLFYETISELRAKYDLSVAMVSHDLSRSVKYADRLVFFDKTVICAGAPGVVLSNGRAREFFGAIAPDKRGGGGVNHHREGQS